MQWDLDYYSRQHGGSIANPPLMGTALGESTNTAWDIVLFSYPNFAGRMGMKLKFRNTSNKTGVLNLTPTTQNLIQLYYLLLEYGIELIMQQH
jgi:hypothetical protein